MKASFLRISVILGLSLPVVTCFVPILAQPLSQQTSSCPSSSSSTRTTSTTATTTTKTTATGTASSSSLASSSDPSVTSSSSSGSGSSSVPTMKWFQHEVTITAPSRGCHLITTQIQKAIDTDLKTIKIGMLNLFIQHTSASLTINENADPDVRRDMEMALNKIVPAEWNRDGTFHHTMEGDDDMPGHVKSSLMGPSLNIPIRNGRLALGTWQGIYLNEHRDQGGWGGGHSRRIILTLQGQA